MKVIHGPKHPKAEEKTMFQVEALNDFSANPFIPRPDEKFTWTLYKSVKGQWKKIEGNIKYGKKVPYTFGEKVVGIPFKIEVHKEGKDLFNQHENKLFATLIVTPRTSKEPIIGRVILLNRGKDNVNKATFNETLTAEARTSNMFGKEITFNLWEEGASEAEKSKKPKTAKVDKNGIAKVQFNLVEYASQPTMLSVFSSASSSKRFYVTASYGIKEVTNKGAVTASETAAKTPQPGKSSETSVYEVIGKTADITAKGIKDLADYFTDKKKTATSVNEVEVKEAVREKASGGKCYCFKQGIVDFSCNGTGSVVTDKHYESLAKDIGVEAKVFKAVAIVESGGRKSFVVVNGEQKAKILYERHYMYRFLKKLKTEGELDSLKRESPDLVHNIGTYKDPNAKYGSEKEQFKKLKRSKLIDNDSAIKSCSWGKFQVMGKYYNYLYSSPNEMEEAMNMCEVQHFAYFKVYLKDVTGASMIKAMKDKNWSKIAELYNGPDYAINKYHTKMKNQYDKL